MDTDNFYRSSDMALVTYLRMNGHSVQEAEWNSTTCHWVFRANDHLLELTERFAKGDALVDPREFNREFAKTKAEFYNSKTT